MTDKELSQLNSLRDELQQLGRRAEEIESALVTYDGDGVFDIVKGSSPNFPYILHDIIVKGFRDNGSGARSGLRKRLNAVKVDIRVKTAELVEEYDRLNRYIMDIADSEMRQILTHRYVAGMSWQQVAFKIGKFDESYPRQKTKKFLNLTEKTER